MEDFWRQHCSMISWEGFFFFFSRVAGAKCEITQSSVRGHIAATQKDWPWKSHNTQVGCVKGWLLADRYVTQSSPGRWITHWEQSERLRTRTEQRENKRDGRVGERKRERSNCKFIRTREHNKAEGYNYFWAWQPKIRRHTWFKDWIGNQTEIRINLNHNMSEQSTIS